MKKFGYFWDGLFLVGWGLYLGNRLWLKPAFPHGIFGWWFNDFLLIPCAMPVLLWLERRCGLRPTDDFPTWGEIVFVLLVWSMLFEVIAPRFYAGTTGDWRDVVAYVAGGVLAGLWWQWHQEKANTSE